MLTKQDELTITKLLKREINPIKKDLKRMEKKTDYMIDVLDREALKDRKRIDKLEDQMKSQKTFA